MITSRHTFGWAKEEELRPVIEGLLGEMLLHTNNRYARHDWDCETFCVELKSRTGASTDYDKWLLPACKIDKAREAKKPTIFFYYFEKDEALFKCVYDERFNYLERSVPHFTKQEHVYVPSVWWERC